MTASEQNEREEFENFVTECKDTVNPPRNFIRRNENGTYFYEWTESNWQSWQAAWQSQQKRIDELEKDYKILNSSLTIISENSLKNRDTIKSLQAKLTIAVNALEYLANADFDSEDAPQDAETQVGWVIDITNSRATGALAEINRLGE